MLRLIAKRLLQMLPTLLIVISITFILTRVLPGDPATMLAGAEADPVKIAELRAEMGLDKSLPQQFLVYVGGLLGGDFGTSISYDKPVSALIVQRIPNTMAITFTGLFIGLLIGVALGIFSAVRQNSALDYICTCLALLGNSLPVFWVAVVCVYIFSVSLGWMPVMGIGSGGLDTLRHMILPCFCLALTPLAAFCRSTRSSMLETLGNNYIRCLRARGIQENRVRYKHALKNALPPIVTILGLQLAPAFSGAILIESIFSWPGMGTLISTAITTRDYALVQGAILVLAVLNVIVGLLMDIIYILIHPRVEV